MPNSRKCPTCGAELPADGPESKCAVCLLQSAEATLKVNPEEAAPSSVVSEKPGDRIGRYKLLEKIGEGGMGTVWMAEQTEPVRRRVALKVIKPGMDSGQVLARYEAER